MVGSAHRAPGNPATDPIRHRQSNRDGFANLYANRNAYVYPDSHGDTNKHTLKGIFC